jgi:hypothetical protein
MINAQSQYAVHKKPAIANNGKEHRMMVGSDALRNALNAVSAHAIPSPVVMAESTQIPHSLKPL